MSPPIKCPICPHECESYETLFTHLMQYHKKNDVAVSLCKLMEDVEKLKAEIRFVNGEMEKREQKIKTLEDENFAFRQQLEQDKDIIEKLEAEKRQEGKE